MAKHGITTIDAHLGHLDAVAGSLTMLRNLSASALISETAVSAKAAWATTLHAAQQALSAMLECRHELSLGKAGPEAPAVADARDGAAHLADVAAIATRMADGTPWALSQLAARKVLWLLPALQRCAGERNLAERATCPALPGRPEHLQLMDYCRYEVDRDYPRRKLHQQVFNVEVCAGEVCAMLVLRFAGLPPDIQESLTLQCVEEFRHAELLLDALAAEGGRIGETPVSLGIWKNCRAARQAADCIGLEQVIGEGFSLGADLYYAELYRAMGRNDISALHECIYIDEVNHVKNGLASFRRLLGDESGARLAALEAGSTAKVIGGRYFDEATRRYVGFSDAEIERQRLRSQPAELPNLKGLFA